MRLERHVGGMGRARQRQYLTQRGWREEDGAWFSPREPELGLALARALHHQLTFDLCYGLSLSGWRVEGYSSRGYAQLQAPNAPEEKPCSLPNALRRQARLEGRKVGELTYSLFLAALVEDAGEEG